MALSIVQRGQSHSAGSLSHSASFGGACSPGNLLVAVARSAWSTEAITITSTGFVEATHIYSLNSFFSAFVWAKLGATGGETSVTFTTNASTQHDMEIYEVTGASSWAIDTPNIRTHDNTASTANTTEPVPTTGSLPSLDEFMVAVCGLAPNPATGAAIDSSFTVRDTGTFIQAIIADKIVSDGSPQAPTFSWSTGNRALSALVGFSGSIPAGQLSGVLEGRANLRPRIFAPGWERPGLGTRLR